MIDESEFAEKFLYEFKDENKKREFAEFLTPYYNLYFDMGYSGNEFIQCTDNLELGLVLATAYDDGRRSAHLIKPKEETYQFNVMLPSGALLSMGVDAQNGRDAFKLAIIKAVELGGFIADIIPPSQGNQ